MSATVGVGSNPTMHFVRYNTMQGFRRGVERFLGAAGVFNGQAPREEGHVGYEAIRDAGLRRFLERLDLEIASTNPQWPVATSRIHELFPDSFGKWSSHLIRGRSVAARRGGIISEEDFEREDLRRFGVLYWSYTKWPSLTGQGAIHLEERVNWIREALGTYPLAINDPTLLKWGGRRRTAPSTRTPVQKARPPADDTLYPPLRAEHSTIPSADERWPIDPPMEQEEALQLLEGVNWEDLQRWTDEIAKIIESDMEIFRAHSAPVDFGKMERSFFAAAALVMRAKHIWEKTADQFDPSLQGLIYNELHQAFSLFRTNLFIDSRAANLTGSQLYRIVDMMEQIVRKREQDKL